MKSVIILGENFINDQNDYIVSSGDSEKDNIYDQDPVTQWSTNGSSEGASATLQVDFKNRVGAVVSRTINRLILLNCNLAKFKIEQWDGAAWQNISEADFTVTPNTTADIYIEMASPVTTQKLKITATNTIGAVAEKIIGEFKSCLLIVSLRHQVVINRRDWDNGGDYRLNGGALVTFIDVFKMEASVQIRGLSLTNYELIIDLIQDREWMTWVLYEDFRRADIYEVKATAQPTENLDKKMQLYTLGFPIKER